MNQPDPMPSQEAPTSHILADRACITCGFNLYGQPVHTEPHYNLAITRCPECGTVAALQQYPTASHLVGRFRALFALIFMVLLILSLGSAALNAFAYTVSTSIHAGANIESGIYDSFNAYREDQNALGRTRLTQSDQQDWLDANADAIIEGLGGARANISYTFIDELVEAGFVAFSFGLTFSLLMLGASRRKVFVISLLIVLLGALFTLRTDLFIEFTSVYVYIFSKYTATLYAPVMYPLTLTLFAACMLIGVFAARPIARQIILFALPPRLRAPFGILWTRDSLSPPSPKPVSNRTS